MFYEFKRCKDTNKIQTQQQSIYKFIVSIQEDTNDLATRAAKEYYIRIRLFSFYEEKNTWRRKSNTTLQ